MAPNTIELMPRGRRLGLIILIATKLQIQGSREPSNGPAGLFRGSQVADHMSRDTGRGSQVTDRGSQVAGHSSRVTDRGFMSYVNTR